jgi:signal recognition particle receptor subunit beta
MPLVNLQCKDITLKIVYYGPGLGGKTTNLQYIHSQLAPSERGELVKLATETECTLYFDFMPMNLGLQNGFTIRMGLYTVPGQVEYNRSRRLILQGVDGIVFVADSSPDRLQANLDSMVGLVENLRTYSLDLKKLPWVLQYNKRDIINALPLKRLASVLNPQGTVPEFESIAIDGKGVFAALKAITKLSVSSLSKS